MGNIMGYLDGEQRREYYNKYREANRERINAFKRRRTAINRIESGIEMTQDTLQENDITVDEYNHLRIKHGLPPIILNPVHDMKSLTLIEIENIYRKSSRLTDNTVKQYLAKLQTLNRQFNDNSFDLTPLLNNPELIVENLQKTRNTIKSYFTPIIFIINNYPHVNQIMSKPKIDFIKKYFAESKEIEAHGMLAKTNLKTVDFQELLSKVKDKYLEGSKEYTLFCLYDNYAFRDDLNLIITDDLTKGHEEEKYDSTIDAKQNYLFVSHDGSMMVFLNHYKTVKTYGRKMLVVHKHLDSIQKYLKITKKKNNDRLFDIKNLSLLIARINKAVIPNSEEYGNLSINFLRHSLFSTYNITEIQGFNSPFIRLLYTRQIK